MGTRPFNVPIDGGNEIPSIEGGTRKTEVRRSVAARPAVDSLHTPVRMLFRQINGRLHVHRSGAGAPI
jgi:hypothetical protein